jgi:hypothetical protein
MVKIKQSGYKSTGDRAERSSMPALDTAIHRMSRKTHKMLISSDEDEDMEMLDPDVEDMSPLSPTSDSPVAVTTVQTRSGNKPPKPRPEEVGHSHVRRHFSF